MQGTVLRSRRHSCCLTELSGIDRFTKLQAKAHKGKPAKETGGKRGADKKAKGKGKATKPKAEKETPANPADLDAQLAAFKSETPAGMDDALEQYKAGATEEEAADLDETMAEVEVAVEA